MNHLLRHLPSIKELQDDRVFAKLEEQIDRFYLTEMIKKQVSVIRRELVENLKQNDHLAKEEIKKLIFANLEREVERLLSPAPKPVINATGVVLHTNLGRARLGKTVGEAVRKVAENYSTLEFEVEEGKRGSRHESVEDLLTLLTGAEAAMVVNNNAAAVYLILRALSKGKDVMVSRGELVEIGGSFRISSIMEESDAKLVEVGTTNKTHLYDYENGLTEDTTMILKVHRSNFAMTGFTEEVSGETLAQFANDHDLIFYEDLGSGAFFDFKKAGIGQEPVIDYAMTKQRDLLSASGDKLFGGPQAGIIFGKKNYINQLKKHQLARVLRVDKMTLAAMNATLKSYLQRDGVQDNIPTLGAIGKKSETIQGEVLQAIVQLEENETDWMCLCESTVSRVGGGTMPTVELESFALTLNHPKFSAFDVAKKLRELDPPIITYTHQEKVWLDFRTLTQEEIDHVLSVLKNLIDIMPKNV